jgi:hypothetical protein
MAEKKPDPPQLNVGEVMVGDYVPSAEDLARLERNKVVEPPKPVDPPEKPLAERMSIIPPSTATRTMAEIERGAALVKQKEEDRRRRLEMVGR